MNLVLRIRNRQPKSVQGGNVNSSILKEYVIIFSRLLLSEVKCGGNNRNSHITDTFKKNYIKGRLSLLDVF